MLPDAEHVIVMGHEEGHGNRFYLQKLDGGQARPFTPEGIKTMLGPISPDGKYVIGRSADDKWMFFPIDGGTPRPIPGLGVGTGGIDLGAGTEVPNAWSADGQSLYLHEHGPQELALFRLDLRTGQKKLWKKIRLPGPGTVAEPVVAADGRTYAYAYTTRTSDLYLLEGLRSK
jgi:Tol biopolymer transport system component